MSIGIMTSLILYTSSLSSNISSLSSSITTIISSMGALERIMAMMDY